MENNKRILNYSEFNKEYENGGLKAGNDQHALDLLKTASTELEKPSIESENKIDSVEAGDSTKRIKTDYEKAPSAPSGPYSIESSDMEVSKKPDIDKIKEKIKNHGKKKDKDVSSSVKPKEESKKETQNVDTDKKEKASTPAAEKERQREEKGNY